MDEQQRQEEIRQIKEELKQISKSLVILLNNINIEYIDLQTITNDIKDKKRRLRQLESIKPL